MSGTAENSIPAQPNKPHTGLQRRRFPVFVMGCHRSGTNLLYDTLLSAGGFAIYRGYLPIHETLIPRFGSLQDPGSREKLIDTWMRSKAFMRAGLEAGPLSSQLLGECRNGGDFIRIVMDAIAFKQGVQRWAVYDPDSVLHVAQINREIKDPLFVHIIRDGRDIALSLMKMGGFRPFPWTQQAPGLLETALYWEWMVHNGRQHGSRIPENYIEIHYEDLVAKPRATLSRLGVFLDHDLDYDRIKRTGLGRLRKSNSSFIDDEEESRRPLNRWKEKLSHQQVVELETLIGPTLVEFGYPLTIEGVRHGVGFRGKCLGAFYPGFLSAKHWLKLNTPLGRFSSLSVLELDQQAYDTE